MSTSGIGDYALLSDCHSAALVHRGGSIDWACLRRFDVGSAFCRLLDGEKGGFFSLRPVEPHHAERRYVDDTNVLETTFLTERGRVRVYDCFAMRRGGRQRPHHQLLRIVEGVEGHVELEAVVEPRFDYGELPPWIRPAGGHLFTLVGGDDALVLQSDCKLTLDRANVRLAGRWEVTPRRRCRFALTSFQAHQLQAKASSARVLDRRLEETLEWWRRWVARGHTDDFGEYRDIVVRSSIVLKALTCAPTGAIIAAPTTSLPERLGGERNWDYRYSWVRDASLTMSALMSVGHPEVAAGFRRFLERTAAGRADDLQILYGCYGERRLPELELSHLAGYRGAKPVRVGNGAAKQQQLDIFGEVLQASHMWSLNVEPPSEDEWRFLAGLVEAAAARWRDPDQGLWESRGPPRHNVHSKVMCWVALHRGIELACQLGRTEPVERWRKVEEEIRRAIDQEGVDPERGCFVQAFGSQELDAALLLLPIVGFVDPKDPRMLETVKQIRQELGQGPLLRRYRTERSDDGLEGNEGAFLMASFWLVEVLAMQGELQEARACFEQLLPLANDLGLYSEEYSLRDGLLGNFPQAFTHMALIGAATQLSEVERHGVPGRSSVSERCSSRRGRIKNRPVSAPPTPSGVEGDRT